MVLAETEGKGERKTATMFKDSCFFLFLIAPCSLCGAMFIDVEGRLAWPWCNVGRRAGVRTAACLCLYLH